MGKAKGRGNHGEKYHTGDKRFTFKKKKTKHLETISKEGGKRITIKPKAGVQRNGLLSLFIIVLFALSLSYSGCFHLFI